MCVASIAWEIGKHNFAQMSLSIEGIFAYLKCFGGAAGGFFGKFPVDVDVAFFLIHQNGAELIAG